MNRVLKQSGWVLLCWMVACMASAAVPDWNEQQITWHSYETGLAEAKASGKPVVLIFYADWCPTCHAYKNIFNKPQIVELAKQLVMIRVNIDIHPELSKRYDLDGDYVPRIFVVNAQGTVDQRYTAGSRYRYFIKARDVAAFEQLLAKAIANQHGVQ